jgi:hypothetical protein
MKNYNNKGITSVLIVILIAVAIIAAVLWYFYQNGLNSDYLMPNKDKIMLEEEGMTEETSSPPSAQPVSSDDSIETIEAELNATITGSPETELDSLNEDASSL